MNTIINYFLSRTQVITKNDAVTIYDVKRNIVFKKGNCCLSGIVVAISHPGLYAVTIFQTDGNIISKKFIVP